jgi:hypothetical protein
MTFTLADLRGRLVASHDTRTAIERLHAALEQSFLPPAFLKLVHGLDAQNVVGGMVCGFITLINRRIHWADDLQARCGRVGRDHETTMPISTWATCFTLFRSRLSRWCRRQCRSTKPVYLKRRLR